MKFNLNEILDQNEFDFLCPNYDLMKKNLHEIYGNNILNDFEKVNNLFFETFEKNNYSTISLSLLDILLNFYPNNIVYWYHRRKNLILINFNPKEELNFTNNLILNNCKTYQAWYHRLWVYEKFEIIPENFNCIIPIIESYSVNFHAWNHLRKISVFFKKYEEGLRISKIFLLLDSTNNSAWNLRSSLISYINYSSEEEISFCISLLKTKGSNESTCLYLNRIISNNKNLAQFTFNLIQKFHLLHPEDFSITYLIIFINDILNINNNDLINFLIQNDSSSKKFLLLFQKNHF